MMRLAFACVVVGSWHATPVAHRRWLVGAGAAVVSVPVALSGVAFVTLQRARRFALNRRHLDRAAQAELTVLGELVVLGLTAGMPFATALEAAVPHLQSPLRAEVRMVVRDAARSGREAALARATGHARRLYAVVARAMSTGAPVLAAVEGFLLEERSRAANLRLLALRRLPVRLVVPLALLILPGFVLLTVAPAIVGAVDRFGL